MPLCSRYACVLPSKLPAYDTLPSQLTQSYQITIETYHTTEAQYIIVDRGIHIIQQEYRYHGSLLTVEARISFK
jgi:hypothetical protein